MMLLVIQLPRLASLSSLNVCNVLAIYDSTYMTVGDIRVYLMDYSLNGRQHEQVSGNPRQDLRFPCLQEEQH
jgi:hypothetical protein